MLTHAVTEEPLRGARSMIRVCATFMEDTITQPTRIVGD